MHKKANFSFFKKNHKKAAQNPVQRVHAGGCFERNRLQGKNSKSTLLTSIPKKTPTCMNR